MKGVVSSTSICDVLSLINSLTVTDRSMAIIGKGHWTDDNKACLPNNNSRQNNNHDPLVHRSNPIWPAVKSAVPVGEMK